ncbi:hypothetical protein SAMN04487931_103250 [Desulfobacula phenolica]|uniref:Uncharacterized protein n=1 Tax=Desulfobacula phenolica TaxID=90732 RepID=A0A1H2ENR1_9BACT|nr:hypothetical protein SAMN04487931_103250 [Desulfobacula phenolica]
MTYQNCMLFNLNFKTGIIKNNCENGIMKIHCSFDRKTIGFLIFLPK